MPNQFFTSSGEDIEDYFISEYWLIDQFAGDELWVWGNNFVGAQLGTNDLSLRSTPSTTFAGGTNWKQVSAGPYYSFAIKTDGTLWGWGANNDGQLGTGDTINRSTPVTTIAGGNDWKQVSCCAGNTTTTTPNVLFTAAIKTDGTLWTWGNGVTLARDVGSALTPLPISAGAFDWADTSTTNPEDLYTIDIGFEDGTTPDSMHSKALKSDGTLWSWGNTSGSFLRTPSPEYSSGGDWRMISNGSNHTLAIKTDGTLWGWGEKSYIDLDAQLSYFWRNTVIPITPLIGSSGWRDATNPEDLYTISASGSSAAIKTDGTLWLWGNNGGSGSLGNGGLTDAPTPVTTFAGGTNWKQVSCGYNYAAAVKTDGTLWTWGSGTSGKLGHSQTTGRGTPITTFAGGTNWKQVSCGFYHTAAIKTDGTLWTWGDNGFGELGINIFSGSRSTPVTVFRGGTNWKQVSCGNHKTSPHTAAVKTDGSLWLWGYNTLGKLGQLGNFGSAGPQTTSVGGFDWKQVSCGYDHTAAIKTDGTLWVWGGNTRGELGTNNNTQQSTPVTTFAGGTNWKQVYAGSRSTFAVKTDGTLWTWGSGSILGSGNTADKRTPITTIIGGSDWTQVSASIFLKNNGVIYSTGDRLGAANLNLTGDPNYPVNIGIWKSTGWKNVSTSNSSDGHTAAINNDGTLWVWGNNFSGQLGNNNTISGNIPVTTFSGGNNWKQVSCGPAHTASIKTDGTLWTWGSGLNGRLGNIISSGNRLTPVTTFSGGTNWKQVSCGNVHTAAIKTDGTLWTWGRGLYGRLGDNNNSSDRINPRTTFAGGTDWKQVTAGNYHTTAVKTDGTLWVWGGNNYGQLGINSREDKSVPVTTFIGGNDWRQVSSTRFGLGSATIIALKGDGINNELYLWGSNVTSSLGTFNAPSRLKPGQILDVGWIQVSCGDQHIAAIKDDGTLWGWGNNFSGQLGTFFISATVSTPVTTFAGGNNWRQVSCGYKYTMATKSDGTLWGWGNGTPLAVFSTSIKATPVTTRVGGNNWRQVSCGRDATAALKNDGTLWVWGNKSSGITGTSGSISGTIFTPATTFVGGTNWKQVSVSKTVSGHMGAIKTDGSLWVWGNNQSRQAGRGPQVFTNFSTPTTTFAGGNNWRQVSCGGRHTLAVKTGIDPNLPFA